MSSQGQDDTVSTVAAAANEPSTSQQPQQQQQATPEEGSPTATPLPTNVKAGGKPKGNKNNPMSGPIVRLRHELNEIMENPPPNCSAEIHNDDMFHWHATVVGPMGTVYENGIFKLDIRFPEMYPFRPPQIRFTTRIYHCNVDSRGIICLDVLKDRWSPVLNISKVLLSIWVLMGECNPNDPLVTAIAEQYKNNRQEHDRIARSWTLRYASPKTKPKDSEQEEAAAADSNDHVD